MYEYTQQDHGVSDVIQFTTGLSKPPTVKSGHSPFRTQLDLDQRQAPYIFLKIKR